VFTNLIAVGQSTAESVQSLSKAYNNEEQSAEAILREELLSTQSQAAQSALVESTKISLTRSKSSG